MVDIPAIPVDSVWRNLKNSKPYIVLGFTFNANNEAEYERMVRYCEYPVVFGQVTEYSRNISEFLVKFKRVI